MDSRLQSISLPRVPVKKKKVNPYRKRIREDFLPQSEMEVRAGPLVFRFSRSAAGWPQRPDAIGGEPCAGGRSSNARDALHRARHCKASQPQEIVVGNTGLSAFEP